MSSMHAVLLAGGQGTRLRPLTNARPKPLVPFMGAPFAAGLLSNLRRAGFTRASILVGADPTPFGPLVRVGERLGVDVRIVPEDEPLDTAGSARRLLAGSGERDVLVCNGDVLTDVPYEQLVDTHRRSGADATLSLMRVPDTSSYGVVEVGPDCRVRSFLEKPPPGTTDHDTVNAGAYVLNTSVFDAFPDGALSFERDVFPGLLKAGAKIVGSVPSAYWQDLGTPERLRHGHRAVLAGRCRWPWQEGLESRRPLVAVHREATVDPSARLGGPVVIGRRCRVGPRAVVSDSVLFDGAQIGPDAAVRESVVGTDAVVWSHAVVGPDQVVADREVVHPAARPVVGG